MLDGTRMALGIDDIHQGKQSKGPTEVGFNGYVSWVHSHFRVIVSLLLANLMQV